MSKRIKKSFLWLLAHAFTVFSCVAIIVLGMGAIAYATTIGTDISTDGDLTVDTNTLFVDSDNNRVGIGTTTPSQKLDIEKGHIRFSQVAAPSSAPTVAINATAGNLNGTYYYKITFVTALGETETGTRSAAVSPANQQVDLSNILVSSDSDVIARKIYRTLAGGSRYYAFHLLTTINNNTATTYTDNIADASLGADELKINTTGGIIYNGSTRVGVADNVSTAWGMNTLTVNSGDRNTAIGKNALRLNTTGRLNSAMGYYTLASNTTGDQNVAMGAQALYLNTTGIYNAAMGMDALYWNSTGSYNSAVGRSLISNTTGSYNSALGYLALGLNSTGSYNSAMGYYSLYKNKPTSKAITGFADYSGTVAGTVLATSTAHGLSAGTTAGVGIYGTTNYDGTYTVTKIDADSFYFTDTWVADDATGWWGIDAEGKNNTAVGYYAGYNGITGSNNVFLGNYAGAYELGSNAFYVDNQDRTNTAGDKAKALLYGTFAALSADQNLTINAHLNVTGTSTFTGISTFAGNVGIGTTSPDFLLDVDGDFRVGIEAKANTFYVDTTNERIGIGTSTPSAKLTVDSGSSAATTTIDLGKFCAKSLLDNGTVIYWWFSGITGSIATSSASCY